VLQQRICTAPSFPQGHSARSCCAHPLSTNQQTGLFVYLFLLAGEPWELCELRHERRPGANLPISIIDDDAVFCVNNKLRENYCRSPTLTSLGMDFFVASCYGMSSFSSCQINFPKISLLGPVVSEVIL